MMTPLKFASICVIQMYGICFIMLGAVCLFGYLFNIPPLASLGAKSDMAPSTAVGFVMVGTSYFFIAKIVHGPKEPKWGSRNP
jgi:hypothetical protein